MSAPRWPEGGPALSADVIAAALGQFPPTPAQREVIEAPPVPALVVAGAGSGKTETMAGRVVWLVANGHVAPEEVLGLTFTRKAAGELAERIGARLARIGEFAERGLLPHLPRIVAEDRLARVAQAAARTPAAERAVRRQVLDELAAEFATGWDPARHAGIAGVIDRPRVATYNAFADAIVREHAARISRDPEAALLSPSASWLLARRVVMDATDAGLEDLENAVSTIIDAVQRLAGDIVDHRADPDAVAAFAAEFARDIDRFRDPSRATKREIEKAWDNLTALPRLLALVRAYEEEKRRRGVLDFADQVTGALEIVEGSPQLADELRAQYRVVLLDEYQDTSVIQTELLRTVFRDGAVMAVGDPNQSIYGWRGASADNLHAFAGAFAREVPSARYDLSVSWRNDRAILSAANRLLQPLRERGGLPVPPLGDRPGAGEGEVSRHYATTVEEEADAVAAWFAAERAVEDGRTGAVLFRAKKHMQLFADALDRHGVPHRILGLGGLLSTPEVTDVVAALRVVHDPTQGSALIRLLVGPRFGVGVADMGALYDLAATLSRRDGALAPLPDELLERLRTSAGADEQVSIVDALDFVRSSPDDYRLLAAISPEGRARLREAGAMFERLRRAAGQPVTELIRLIESELRLDIELAANETRGSASTATIQLRAFADEVRAFLDADERGTLGSLLSWLDHAEQTDELMPRTEPPEPGVVQLLTIHGSKGLEWDSVAVVRLSAGELPKTPTGTAGWLGFGMLPYAFRGDRAALPRIDWEPTPETDAKELEDALKAFKEAGKEHQLEEERRLAYVAVTRARSRLLLTGSYWAGQSRPRPASPFLDEIVDELGLDPVEPLEDETDPYAGTGGTVQWPLDALGARRGPVTAAAAAVREAAALDPRPSPELARLLAERRLRERERPELVPTRIPASRFKDYVTDFAGTLSQIARPMPERPYRQTRLGTLFHQWVEQRSGRGSTGASTDDALWELDEDVRDDAPETTAGDEEELARLRRNFERSEWGALRPLEVETEIDFALPAVGGAPRHIVICKLDAVYRREDRGGRIEIVDWKTGRAPRTETEREERMLQLALYRLAYHRRHGIPLEEIDVALYYVSDDLVLRGDRVYTAEQLAERWHLARGA